MSANTYEDGYQDAMRDAEEACQRVGEWDKVFLLRVLRVLDCELKNSGQ